MSDEGADEPTESTPDSNSTPRIKAGLGGLSLTVKRDDDLDAEELFERIWGRRMEEAEDESGDARATPSQPPLTGRRQHAEGDSGGVKGMDSLKASVTIHAPPRDVYDFLVDFTSYDQYCDYIDHVAKRGDGGVGTTYGIEFSWWKLTYTAWSRVTGLEEGERIDWEVIKDIDARGSWHLDRLEDADLATHDGVATRVTLNATYDPASADGGELNLPPFVPMSTVISKVEPVVFDEAQRVIARVVRDLEGEPRDATLTIHESPDSV